MKKYCSTCKHGKPGPWVEATINTERHRIVECGYELPSLPIWTQIKLQGCNCKRIESYTGRAETTCQTWEKK